MTAQRYIPALPISMTDIRIECPLPTLRRLGQAVTKLDLSDSHAIHMQSNESRKFKLASIHTNLAIEHAAFNHILFCTKTTQFCIWLKLHGRQRIWMNFVHVAGRVSLEKFNNFDVVKAQIPLEMLLTRFYQVFHSKWGFLDANFCHAFLIRIIPEERVILLRLWCGVNGES